MIKSKSTGIILAVVIFIVGVACGMLADRVMVFHKMLPFPMRMNQKQEKWVETHMMDRMSKKLSLTQEQKDKLGPIFKKHKEEMDAMAKTVRVKFQEIKGKMDQEIKAILNDAQKTKFEEIRKRHEARAAKEGKEKTMKGRGMNDIVPLRR
ncbi:MAG: hypothetical protein A2297_04705 [Elusimicrobia bacterium RIFOXYB2_FULL_48_7]|nr:MAG: hypothetical protein A2297_04705 [Elusimicrobia bacterium RIFOXYB2_FULL_48_7]